MTKATSTKRQRPQVQRVDSAIGDLKPIASQAIEEHQVAKQGLSTIGAFIKLGRPKFLPYSAILLLLGSLFAVQATGEPMTWAAYGLGLLFVWTAHLATHYGNEHFDLQADMLNETPTKWTGGSRVLVDGHLPIWSALLTCMILTAFATFQIWVAGWTSKPVIHISALILALSWSYTAPPFRLHYHSFGELTVATVLTTLVPILGFAIHPSVSSTWEGFSIPTTFTYLLFLLAVQQWARMVVMNIPDVEGDLLGHKITFAARVGVKASGLIYAATQVALLVSSCFLMPLPLLTGFLATSYLGIKTALRVMTATQAGSWDHSEANVDIPFQATMHCAGTAAVCVCIKIIERALGNM